MKQIFTNISLVFLSILVVFLSIGLSISKMHCSKSQCPEDGKIFFGTEVPYCIEKQEIACNIVLNEFSCCEKKEIETSCCSDKEDNSCASETENIQFDFETLTTSFDFNFKQISVLLYTCFLYDKICNLKQHLNYPKGIPLLKLTKPELAEIQSFLL